MGFLAPLSSLRIISSDCVGVEASLRSEEIVAAIKSMGALKTPRVDGFHRISYQKCWDVVRADLLQFVPDVFRNPCPIQGVNELS